MIDFRFKIITRDARTKPARIAIAAPKKGRAGYSCMISVTGFGRRRVQGADNLLVTVLAIGYVAAFVAVWKASGVRTIATTGEPLPLDKYFSAIGSARRMALKGFRQGLRWRKGAA
jgi:hypothetical protein